MNLSACVDEVCRCASREPAPASARFESRDRRLSRPRVRSAWRDELSARLNRYRARRKVRPPRYPSLSLRFDAVESSASANTVGDISAAVYVRAGFESCPRARWNEAGAVGREAEAQSPAGASPRNAAPAVRHPARSSGGQARAKIIEFPRFAWGPPAPPPDQLAEPVSGRPRILEVPEVAPAAAGARWNHD